MTEKLEKTEEEEDRKCLNEEIDTIGEDNIELEKDISKEQNKL